MGGVIRAIVGAVALVAALAFSAVAFVVVLVIGIAAFIWLQWRARAWRRQQAAAASSQNTTSDGSIYEGEAVRVTESDQAPDQTVATLAAPDTRQKAP